MKNIVCFHLFNDYSGSPKVLKTVIEGLLESGYHIDLVTSRGGVLDELEGKENLRLRQYNYRFARNTAVRALRYALVQIRAFFIALSYLFKRNTVIYINTILPLGAAIGGRIAGKKVVYHYHENAKAKSTSYRILAKFMQILASEIVCVSSYQRSFLKRKKRIHIIPNALQKEFTDKIYRDSENAFAQRRVLMLGSLKGYKGTKEFIDIAKKLEQFNFELVINDSQEEIDKFIKKEKIEIPANISIHPRQKDVVPFYNRATIVINLTNKKQAIETFGLTALEAMTAGLPTIVPTVGGIAEMVTDGENGYRIDVQEIENITKTVEQILTDKDLFVHLSNNALKCSKKYSAEQMVKNIAMVF